MRTLAASILTSVLTVCDLLAEHWHTSGQHGWDVLASVALGITAVLIVFDR